MATKWTDELDAKLLDLRGKGHNLAQIGKIMKMSKNAIVGRNSRLMKWGKAPPMIKIAEQGKPKINGKPPIIDAHPAFDPTDNVWFLEKPYLEAKTIKGLLDKLPHGSTIKDYKKVA